MPISDAYSRLAEACVRAAGPLPRRPGESHSVFQSAVALTGALIAGASGMPDFTFNFTDERTLGSAHGAWRLERILRTYGFVAQPFEAASGHCCYIALTVSAPGAIFARWFQTPAEGEPAFFPAYTAMAGAVQRTLRLWLPYIYFSDPQRYEDLDTAWPLLVYESMPPFTGRWRGEFTHDIVSPNERLAPRQPIVRALARQMRRVAAILRASGRSRMARFYLETPADTVLESVERQPAWLNALLAADAFFVDSLSELGVRAREAASLLGKEPGQAVRDFAHFAVRFGRRFHRRLLWLYGWRSFAGLGSLLLLEATRALGCRNERRAPFRALLRVRSGREERVFVNEEQSN